MTSTPMLRTLFGSSLLALSAAPALAQSQTFLDLEAGIGYATNPLLRVGDDEASGYGRVSAYGYRSWENERGATSLSAYVENTSYLRRLGNRQIFDLSASHSSQASEKMRIFGGLSFNGDFGGQLSTRFFGVPENVVLDPPIPDNLVIVTNPDLIALNQRQYRLTGQAGASFALSPRDSLGTNFGAQRVFFSGNNGTPDYNLYDLNLSYRRQINERLSTGVRTIGSYADYGGDRSILSYGPQATVEFQLAERLQASAAVGFVRTELDRGGGAGSVNSTDLALDASLCRNVANDRLCLAASRRTQSSVLGAAPVSTSVSGSFARRLNVRDAVQASLVYVRTGGVAEVGIAKQDYFSLAGNYSRSFSDRLSGGIVLSARKLNLSGPDPKNDYSASLSLRNRFGSIR